MQVVSVNLGEKRTIRWKRKEVETGIFKYPVNDPITLGYEDVENDHVVDRKYHGGIDKACYLFSADVYPSWKSRYPQLSWDWGMFGENVTVRDLDESRVHIGSTYRIGTALVEVSEPRQPCFKLGIRFGTQKVLKDFIAAGHSGVYVRVLTPGVVKAGDQMTLIEKGSDLSILDIFQLIYQQHKNPELIHKALQLKNLAEGARRNLQKL
ncbi:MAG: MOSC domain-containing protein [Marinoscillum sp.]|uniref:MOSC domain-containing protein n=1 Tax=Marinoscillum sp. TaxID=2024838 RepID=UPI0032F1A4AF